MLQIAILAGTCTCTYCVCTVGEYNVPYSPEKGPMGGVPYIRLKLEGGPDIAGISTEHYKVLKVAQIMRDIMG